MDKLISDNHMATVKQALVKVPEVTLLFWIIKIVATTLGETAGDALSMSLNLGYIVSTNICRHICYRSRHTNQSKTV